MFWIIYAAVLFAAWAMMVREGLWSNTITLVNILVSGLIAFGLYSPLAIQLDEMTSGSYTYWIDFACIWVLFIITMLICRVVTDFASRTRLRFKNPIEPVGGPLMGLFAAWVLVSFVTATLHTSPMPANAFGGKLVHSESEVDSSFALMSPDLAWLRFVEAVSAPASLGSGNTDRFRAPAFVKIYGKHREQFADGGGLRVDRR